MPVSKQECRLIPKYKSSTKAMETTNWHMPKIMLYGKMYLLIVISTSTTNNTWVKWMLNKNRWVKMKLPFQNSRVNTKLWAQNTINFFLWPIQTQRGGMIWQNKSQVQKNSSSKLNSINCLPPKSYSLLEQMEVKTSDKQLWWERRNQISRTNIGFNWTTQILMKTKKSLMKKWVTLKL